MLSRHRQQGDLRCVRLRELCGGITDPGAEAECNLAGDPYDGAVGKGVMRFFLYPTFWPASRFSAGISLPAILGVVLAATSAPVVAESSMSNYFADSYPEARGKFISAAEAAGGRLAHYRNPRTGAAGEVLYVDVATFNLPDADTVVVLGSGTHGIEGFAGSAIQVGLLKEGIADTLPENVGMLFYHALNPYGFSQLRRFDGENVDLNRNFVDHAQPHPTNEGYERIAWLVEPASLSAWQNFKAKIGLAWYRITKGARWLQSAISRGQYTHPEGLFYGGRDRTWSNQTLMKIVEGHLATAARVILIDVHTGLGDYGAAVVFTEAQPGTSEYEWMAQCWEIPISNPSVSDASSSSITGSLKGGFASMISRTQVIGGSLEFGTFPPLEVLWALRAENHVHHHGGWEHPDAERVKEELKRVFYPQRNDWMHSVWRQGSRLVKRTIACAR